MPAFMLAAFDASHFWRYEYLDATFDASRFDATSDATNIWLPLLILATSHATDI